MIPKLSVTQMADRDAVVVRAAWPDALLRHAVSWIEIENCPGDIVDVVRGRMFRSALLGPEGSADRAASLAHADWTPVHALRGKR
jgi:hypothetical protein